nr:TPA: NADH dehydrogenase subunit 5 [Bdellodrilus illuminatus]
MKLNINLITPTILMSASLVPLVISMSCLYMNHMIIYSWDFMNTSLFSIQMMVMFDFKGMIFSSVVLFISSNVMIFSNTYMKSDKFINRFTLLVLAFILSMNLLILIPHLIMLLLGWDGLGIISFILVIYYQNSKSLAAGLITALSNRIGDVLILSSIALSLNYGQWFLFLKPNNMEYTNVMILMLMFASMTKSAQIPFSSWLPAAMAAPTPVSALVHSSTLVTAGVFLLVRFYSFLCLYPMFYKVLMMSSMVTLIMSGLCAMMEMDMKKIIALSTLSQLGLMMLSLSLMMPSLTFMHLIIHALFKALLFICAGSLINLHMHSQDMRWMGNLGSQTPLISSAMILSCLTMSGMPFLSAFYSKDMILEQSMNSMNSAFTMIMLYMSLILTSMYSMRLLFSILFINKKSTPYFLLTEMTLTTPLLLLSLVSMLFGLFYSWLNSSIHMNPLPVWLLIMPSLLMIAGILFSMIWVYKMDLIKSYILMFLSSMWFFNYFSSQFLMKYSMKTSKYSLEMMDSSWLEMLMSGSPMNMAMNSYNLYLKNAYYNPVNLIWSSVLFMIVLISIY